MEAIDKSETVKKEYLVKGNADLLNKFLTERNGYFVRDASRQEIEKIIKLGQNATPNRVINTADATVAATAIRDNAPLMTADKRLKKYLQEFNFKVEEY